jgi:hypothetical protein
MMLILIQGPRQPGNDINVFLQPLMKELLQLWVKGERVWDEYKKEHFKLKALLFVTITDLPGLENRELPKFKTGRQIIKIVNKLKVILGKGAGSVPTLAKICVGNNLYFGNCLIGGHCMFGTHLMGCTLPKMSRRACWVP